MVQGTRPLNWLIVGSGPNAPAALARALTEKTDGFDAVITCNAGIRLCCPTHYFLSDHTACGMFVEDAMRARETIGTRLVTIRRVAGALRMRGVQDFDEYITINKRAHPYEYDTGPAYPPHPLSGLYCTTYAIRHGATALTFVGFDGYGSGPDHAAVDYWDGREGKAGSSRHSTGQEHYLRTLLGNPTLPNLRAVHYGGPVYAVPDCERYIVIPLDGQPAARTVPTAIPTPVQSKQAGAVIGHRR